jgi:ribonuclease P protein subunit POP4
MSKQAKSAKIALIGELLEVVSSRNPLLKGLRGKVVDETRNTLKIQTTGGTKTLIKNQVVIKIENKTINGETLSGRIEERLKQ